jgi:hypothetical protein
MSITANKIKTEGNTVYIKSNPYIGILALTSFVDNASGVDGTHTFTKTFRYSENGIIFSEWFELITQNILAIELSQKDTFIIELRYIKNEPVGDNQLNVTQATFGTTNDPIPSGYYFKNSIFYQFFEADDVEVLNWMINVLDKLYQKGLLPNYIDRLNDFGLSDDFIEFWRGICKFAAYYVVYARKYQQFYENDVLLREYLEERGLKTSINNSLEELQYLMQNYYNQIAKRGTIHIIDKTENEDAINGEFLRLINYVDTDEFIFNINRNEHIGWNIDNSSPMHRELTINDNVNKFYESSIEPDDINKYPITGGVTIITDNDIDKKVLHIESGGIEDDGVKRIKVDEFLDYQLMFLIKKEDAEDLTVGIDAFDINGDSINLKSRVDGSNSNTFLQDVALQRDDKYLLVRCFLYSKLKPLYSDDKTNLQIGHNLKMIDGVVYVAPKILIGGEGNIYNIRFCPMVTPYSRGFVQSANFIDCWLGNNNNEYSIKDVTDYTKKYLIPYNSRIQIIETNKASDYSVEA